MKRNTQKLNRLASQLGLILIFALTTLLSACFPKPDPDDEGHATFAREAIPVLLGRRARGVDEVEVVADIAQLLGRDVAVSMLMKDTEYVDHWTNIIMDLLEVQRQNQGGIGVAADQSCWGPPTIANPDPSIAEWVRDHGPNDAGGPTGWNMTDLVRSAVAIDDLSPIFRANLFSTTLRRAGSNGRTNELTHYLMRVYLNRNTDCMGCHNAEASTSNKTDSNGVMLWRRLWSIPGDTERALFGNNFAGGDSVFSAISPIMRGDARQPVGPGFGVQPWGIDTACMQDTNNDRPANDGDLTHEGFRTVPAASANNTGVRFGSLDGSVNGKLSVWELEAALWNGVQNLQDGYERTQPTSANHPAGSDEEMYCSMVDAIHAKCTTCHSATGAASFFDFAGTDPAQAMFDRGVVTSGGNLTNSVLWNRVNGIPSLMPPAAQPQLTLQEKSSIETWIDTGAPNPGDTSICSASDLPEVDPDEAFAYLTASNFIDGVWTKVMGYPLTIEHGFPRNREQRDLLWHLTESVFINNDWSLKSTLSKVMTSEWFARRAPTLSQEGTAYELPPYNPWFAADPTEVANPAAHQKRNGQGEMVNLYQVNTLLRNVANALGWEKPQSFPPSFLGTVDYPHPLDMEMGQYLSPALPGFEGVNFQSLLALESRLGSTGSCDKSGKAVNTDDWIDALTSAIATHNAANPETPVTLGSAFGILKDRLVQDTTIETALPSSLSAEPDARTEAQAVVDFFREGGDATLTLNSSTGELSAVQLDQKLRQLCNVVIKSPQFLLPHITPRGYSDNDMPDPPQLAVCLAGEQCGYLPSCGGWRSKLSGMGHHIICEDRTVRKGTRFFLPGVFIDTGLVLEIDPNRWKTKKPWFQDILRARIDRPTFTMEDPEDESLSLLLDQRPGRLSSSPVITTNPIRTQAIMKNPTPAIVQPKAVLKESAPNRQIMIQRPERLYEIKRKKEDQFDEQSPSIVKSKDLKLTPEHPNPGRISANGVIMNPSKDKQGVQIDVVNGLKVFDVEKGASTELKGVQRLRQRLASLCLDGLCGYSSASNLRMCTEASARETGKSCDRYRTTCDPRCRDGVNCCSDKPVDASNSGVLTLWAEGAVIRKASQARILKLGQRTWKPLEAGVRLDAGDLVDLPLTGEIAIQSGNLLYGDRAIRSDRSKNRGHLLSITGPSAGKVISKRLKKGQLHPAAVAAGLNSGRYLSKGMSQDRWRRILQNQPKPEHKYEPSSKEIYQMLLDYESQHEGMTDQKELSMEAKQ